MTHLDGSDLTDRHVNGVLHWIPPPRLHLALLHGYAGILPYVAICHARLAAFSQPEYRSQHSLLQQFHCRWLCYAAILALRFHRLFQPVQAAFATLVSRHIANARPRPDHLHVALFQVLYVPDPVWSVRLYCLQPALYLHARLLPGHDTLFQLWRSDRTSIESQLWHLSLHLFSPLPAAFLTESDGVPVYPVLLV